MFDASLFVIIQTPLIKGSLGTETPPAFDELPPPNKSKASAGEHGRFQ